ncbi:MAG: SDR family oxidoreductase [Tissierellia bacterium]|jgi:NAD(P)-dependent dehydrogenase (short-subunit alcohol dehydrogenase family)|nr:SDR family oxidoreductase [Tissierellia bacterium]
MYDLSGKTVIITGGGSGIGLGIARAFSKVGANLVLTGRTLSKLENAKEELSGHGGEVLVVTADGGKEEDVKAVVDAAIRKFGRVDVVVNNAQNSASGVPLKDHTEADFDKAIYSGLYATFFYMKHSYEALKENKGRVINFASGAGIAGRAGQSSYAAAKEGIRGMSRVAATEWGPDGITVNVICPLAMTDALANWRKEYPELYEKTISATPMGRFADPETDIGALCVFLSSPDASYITGETFNLQGGTGLRP